MIAGDQEAGDDEEHIDADEAAAEEVGEGVKHNDAEHGDRAQPVNIRTIRDHFHPQRAQSSKAAPKSKRLRGIVRGKCVKLATGLAVAIALRRLQLHLKLAIARPRR